MAKGMAGQSPSAKNPKNINPNTGERYKLTMKELLAKQAKGDTLNKVQTKRLETAGKLKPPPSAPTAKKRPSIQQLIAKQAAGQPLGPKQLARLQRSGRIAPSQATPTQQLTGKQLQQRVGAQTGTGVGQFMDILQQQGAFKPGSFQQQMDAAYQNVMNQYQQTMAPEFAREQADFRQIAAERGLDPNSEAYKTLQTQLNQRQDAARQGAMQNALQAAQQVQQTGFTQALQGYQAPAGMLQAFQPYWQQAGGFQQAQMENRLARQKMAQDLGISEAELANRIQLGQIGATGQLTFEQQMELDRQRNAAAMAVQALKNEGQLAGMPSTGASIASGLASGIGSGIGSWLGNQ